MQQTNTVNTKKPEQTALAKAMSLPDITKDAIVFADELGKVEAKGEKVAIGYADFYKTRQWIIDEAQMNQARTEFLVEDMFAKNTKDVKRYLGEKVDFGKFYRAYKSNRSNDHRSSVFSATQYNNGIDEKARLERGATLEKFAESLREWETRSNNRWAKVARAARKYMMAEIEPQREPESEQDKAYHQWNKPLVRGVENVNTAMLAFFNKYEAKDKASYQKLEPTMREVSRKWTEIKALLKDATIVVTE